MGEAASISVTQLLESAEADLVILPDSVDLIALDEALARLEKRDPRMGEIVKLRFLRARQLLLLAPRATARENRLSSNSPAV